MARAKPKEREEMRNHMKSIIDTSGVDQEMLHTIRGEMGRKERIKMIAAPHAQAMMKAEQGLRRVFGKLTGFLRPKGKK